jgi:hypothetical protein
VFLHLKTFLGGWRHHDNEVKEAISTWSASQVASFYNAGIQKLVPHYDKCLNNGGNYVEKLRTVCTSNGNINGLEINTCSFLIAHWNSHGAGWTIHGSVELTGDCFTQCLASFTNHVLQRSMIPVGR